MTKHKKTKKVRPKRPVGVVIQNVRQVLKISHVSEGESVWQWGEATATNLPAVIDIVTWNIWKSSGGDGFVTEYKKMQSSCHLMLLQEALLTLKALGHFAPKGFAALHGATYKRKDGLREGVMTVSTASIEGEPRRILCLSPEPLLNTTKATLVTNYKIEGSNKTLCVVNTHATLMRRPATAVKELERVIDHIVSHEGPMIYAGDFNTFSPAYLAEVDRVLSTIGLKRVQFSVDPRTTLGSLDQIYVRDIEILDARVDTSYIHSDHFPIFAKLRLVL